MTTTCSLIYTFLKRNIYALIYRSFYGSPLQLTCTYKQAYDYQIHTHKTQYSKKHQILLDMCRICVSETYCSSYYALNFYPRSFYLPYKFNETRISSLIRCLCLRHSSLPWKGLTGSVHYHSLALQET